MSAAEALRRCPQAVFVRPRHALYREYSRSVWETVTRRRADRRADRHGRGLPRCGRGCARLPRGARRRRGGADGGAGCDEPHVLARRGAVQGRGEGGERCAQARRSRRRPVRTGSGVPRAARRASAAGRRAEGGGAAARRGHRDDRGSGRADRRGAAPPAPGQRRHDAPRPRSRHRSARARARHRADLDQRREHVRAGHLRPRAAPRRATGDGRRGRDGAAAPRPGRAHRDDEAPLRGLLDPQPLDLAGTGIDEPETIGDLACRLLDRGLRDRPGALRLVGVGVSGLADFRQLSLEAV